MTRIPFGTLLSTVLVAAAAVFWAITVTHSDAGVSASRAAACSASQAAQENAYCWVDKPATITDTGTVWRTIAVSDGTHGGSRSVLTGWITLNIPPSTTPGPQIPFAEADWPAFDPHKGDKVTARVVRGKVVSVESARGRFGVVDGTPATYPLVFISLVMLVFGLIGARVMRHTPRTGFRHGFARVADRYLVALTVVAIIVFYVHRSDPTVWGIVAAGGATAAGYLAGARWIRADKPARNDKAARPDKPARPTQPAH
ncbi:hypothetical protein ABH920_000620 [Catenulispora sp. EB89]|uniref:hypothetical protein n=1 Tax=Catenulispora sp. EB89 TaxID=3156257 RepID=UPI003518A765